MGNSIPTITDTVNADPVEFHEVHAANVELSHSRFRARRVEGNRGLCFSHRPITVGERVYLKVVAASQSRRHKGISLRFGYTAVNPSSDNTTASQSGRVRNSELASSEHGYWVKAVNETFAKRGMVLGFCFGISGEVMYGSREEIFGVLFSGVRTDIPLWVVIDLCGSASAVEFAELGMCSKSVTLGMTKAALAKYEARRSTRLTQSTEALPISTVEAEGDMVGRRCSQQTFSSARHLARPRQDTDVWSISESIPTNGLNQRTQRRIPDAATMTAANQRQFHRSATVPDTETILQTVEGEPAIAEYVLAVISPAIHNSSILDVSRSRQGTTRERSFENALVSVDHTRCELVAANEPQLDTTSQQLSMSLLPTVLHSSFEGNLSQGAVQQCSSQSTSVIAAAEKNWRPSRPSQSMALHLIATADDQQIQQVTQQLSQPVIRRYRAIDVNKMMPFHHTHGRNVSLSEDFLAAIRNPADFCNAYVFTQQPLWPGQELVVRISAVNKNYAGGLTVGLTSCDPINIRAIDLPDDADALLDRPEYWVVHKSICSRPKVNDELAFHRTVTGQLIYFRNGRECGTLMHVDCTLPLWAFFDVYGTTQKIEIIGVIRRSDRTSYRTVNYTPRNVEFSTHIDYRKPHHNPNSQHSTNEARLSLAYGGLHSSVENQQYIASPAIPSSVSATRPILPDGNHRLSTPAPHVVENNFVQSLTSSITDLLSSAPSSALPPPLIPVPLVRQSLLQDTQSNDHDSRSRDHRMQSNIINSQSRDQIKGIMSFVNGKPPHTPGHSETVDSCVSLEPRGMLSMSDEGKIATVPHFSPGNGECAICMEAEPDCALYACGHMCMCYECAVNVQKQRSALCPICRQPVVDILRIYRT